MRRLALTAIFTLSTGAAAAATCGDTASGFDAWKQAFAAEAQASGVGARGLEALAATQYASRTIEADRNQRSFRYELDEFLRIRGADTIVSQGRSKIANNPNFYGTLEQRYGVPPSVIVAIWGMETGFGNFMGDSNVLSAITTLAYDCRRSDFFTPHAMAALQLVDSGSLSSATIGAMHGEVGHTQFLPGNVGIYGVDGNGDGVVDLTDDVDALASTANFLRQKGWQPGAGFQEGEPNFAVIEQWNAATVYQRAIAVMAGQIDG
ncbi:lytic murein transglycosylase [Loktanella fryxellensis]|uniref:Lytic murein transglycosylase n=1 Tax=Loktanella fryxellensis TaxID=245187 RepID=A0A1H8EQD4_9RHOB|nr:lytic murein transglycosylase [Loktanella fryxellensis]SEN21709.1 lytic murein transglycosylase [Loktanella fryxellensis]